MKEGVLPMDRQKRIRIFSSVLERVRYIVDLLKLSRLIVRREFSQDCKTWRERGEKGCKKCRGRGSITVQYLLGKPKRRKKNEVNLIYSYSKLINMYSF